MIGTISETSLKPLQAYSVKKNASVLEAAQIMAARRTDALLVVEDDETLLGIFTTKDISFKAIVTNSDVSQTCVSSIATSNPICVNIDASNIQALDIMIDKHIRHLPISNLEGNVVGMLDIISCVSQEFDVLKQASTSLFYDNNNSSEELLSLQTDIAPSENSQTSIDIYPKVGLIGVNEQPVIVAPETTIFEAATKMKSQKATAALVFDKKEKLVGILTTKDIVLRVVAAGYDANVCTVELAMTPHPDTISSESSCFEALEQMHKKKYLNIPVINGLGQVDGIVGVLSLCIAIITIFREHRASFGSLDIENTTPDLADETQSNYEDFDDSQVILERSEMSFGSTLSSNKSNHDKSAADIVYYDSGMIDSNSDNYYINTDFNDSSGYVVTEHGDQAFLDYGTYDINSYDTQSKNSNSAYTINSLSHSHYSHSSTLQKISFKFKDPLGNFYRFSMTTIDLTELKTIIAERLNSNGVYNFETVLQEFVIMYLDSDDDFIQINNNEDLYLAVQQTIHLQKYLLVLRLRDTTISNKYIKEYLLIDDCLDDKPTTETVAESKQSEQCTDTNQYLAPLLLGLVGVCDSTLETNVTRSYNLN
ncbi:hypothetical protein BB561_004314 [Smittium simulii]|uniref:CBS domain-containing protein n=1 Tax=Smittium simulii TaxID=133385 RepID=A0A2T9YH12_9FUNG|nr:hypothetical protein BB561_004314 [Smittium simulii]